MPRQLDILDRLHTRLLDIVATALPLMTSSIRDADLAGLAHLRGEMIATLDAYARHVSQHVMAAAIASGDREQMRRAHEIKIGSLSLEHAYRAFTDRWAHRDGTLNWPEYRLSAIVMMKHFRDQVRIASAWQGSGDNPPASVAANPQPDLPLAL